MTKDIATFVAALLLTIGCGAAIALLYDAPTPGLSTPTVEPAHCNALSSPAGTTLTVDGIEACTDAFRYSATSCTEGAPLVVVFTPETRWALRAGDPPVRLRHDDDLALVQAWCTAAEAAE